MPDNHDRPTDVFHEPRHAFDPSRRSAEAVTRDRLSKIGAPPFEIRVELNAMKLGILHQFSGMEETIQAQITEQMDAIIEHYPFKEKIQEILEKELGERMKHVISGALSELFGYNSELTIALKDGVNDIIRKQLTKASNAKRDSRSRPGKG
jgi:hypothetical protein